VRVVGAPDHRHRVDGYRVAYRYAPQVVAVRPQVARALADKGRKLAGAGDLGEQRLVTEDRPDHVDGEPERAGELVVVVGPLGAACHARHPDPVPGELRRPDSAGAGERMAGSDEQLVRLVDDVGGPDRLRQALARGNRVEGGVDRARVDGGDGRVDVADQGHDV